VRIENEKLVVSIDDAKRFYPPFFVYDDCPVCGAEVEGCGQDVYLCYPTLNISHKIVFYCSACEDRGEKKCGWMKPIVIRMTAENPGG